MRFKTIFIGIIVLTILSVFVYTIQNSGQSEEAYRLEINEERVEKDSYMRTSSESPFKDKVESFKGLRYFEPDLSYKVTAKLEPVRIAEYLVLPTSSGKEKKYRKFAYADFTLQGKSHRLLLLKGTDEKSKGLVFLPFADETSGDETYGGGRYIDLDLKNNKQVTIDFNKAYNPYCNYSDGYNCPLPPRENLLDIPVKAGEKTYEK